MKRNHYNLGVLIILEEKLLKILEEYSVERKKPFNGSSFVNFINEDCKNEVESFIKKDGFDGIVETFTVLGQWSDTPWIAIFNKGLTHSINNGCYPIIVCKSDLSGLYLSLNIGLEESQNRYSEDIILLRNEINAEFPNDYLNVINDVNGFNRTCIIAKEYTVEDLKREDCSIQKDLNYFLGIYYFLISSDSTIPVVTWKTLIQDRSVINEKMLDVLNIMYDIGDYATFGEIAEIRNQQNPNFDEKSYNSLNISTGRRIKKRLYKLPMLNADNEEYFFNWLFDFKFRKNIGDWILKDNLKTALMELRKENPLINTQGGGRMSDSNFYDYLISEGYYFDKEVIENFLLSLKVKPFLIFTGNSGTGKTKLAQLYADYIHRKCYPYFENDLYQIIPVGSNWTDNRYILGYYNVIIEEYQTTPSYDLIKNAQNNKDIPFFLILDEMNLSHVERYFSDFLSAIESGKNIPLYGVDEDLEIPENLFIIGTVNIDETTYMFSPKVLDRANTIEFKTTPVNYYMQGKLNKESLLGNLEYLYNPLSDLDLENTNDIKVMKKILKNIKTNNGENLWDVLSDELTKIQETLTPSGFDFGFRVVNEILKFMIVSWYYENTNEDLIFENWSRYFDTQILQKILPKIHGSEKSLGETLSILKNHCKSQKYVKSYEKLEEMNIILKNQKFVSFIK